MEKEFFLYVEHDYHVESEYIYRIIWSAWSAIVIFSLMTLELEIGCTTL